MTSERSRNSHPLTYKDNEQAWQIMGSPDAVNSNEAGDLEISGKCMAINTERAYGDCVITAKWRFENPICGLPGLIFRCLDSRRFYAVWFNDQIATVGVTSWWRTHPAYADRGPFWDGHIMAGVWKGSADGYQRMLGYRRKAGIYPMSTHPRQWNEVRVECVRPEILVFFEDQFVCAVKDDEYQAGLVGVAQSSSMSVLQAAWKHLRVQGQPVELDPAWSVVPNPTLTPATEDTPPLDSCYLPSLSEHWRLSSEHTPGVKWEDNDTNFDELTSENFWIGVSRSKDGGKTWSEKERLNLPYPTDRAYQPIKGKAGGVVIGHYNLRELSDCSIGFTSFWRDKPDGHYHSDQVQFCRSTDGGKSWTMSPVDATEWARNESSWVELANGDLLCVMRSNYECYLGASRSRDKGRTWSQVQPIIPYFNPSAPSLLRTKDNVLILATRGWGLFTSLDNGYTWSPPTDIGSYTGGGWEAQMRELPDGRIVVGGPETGAAAFFTVDREGIIHPAPSGAGASKEDQ